MYEELVWAADEARLRNPSTPWIFPVLLDKVEPPPVDLGGGMDQFSS